jgi:G3E family GTPase
VTDPTDSVPVTVVSGPLGAGKTTLVNRLLTEPGDRRLAVVVNDVGEVNVDAERLGREGEDGVVDLSNGCICCRLGDDLVAQADRLARERAVDCIVVEASGISEPLPIARTLTDAAGAFGLDTTVSVVDAYGFAKAFDPDERLPEAAPEPERPLTDVMVDQVEFCDVLLLNKCDLLPGDELDRVEAAVRELQPRADLYRTTYSEVSPETVLATGRFDIERARRSPGWRRALAGEGHDHDEPAAAAHGVGSTVYERERPFDPDRLDAWLDDWDGRIVRAKGFAYVASRPEEVVGLSQAGPSVRAGPIGEWGDDDPATRLVFIGHDLDADRLAAGLDDCLTDGPTGRPETDPFPREGGAPGRP